MFRIVGPVEDGGDARDETERPHLGLRYSDDPRPVGRQKATDHGHVAVVGVVVDEGDERVRHEGERQHPTMVEVGGEHVTVTTLRKLSNIEIRGDYCNGIALQLL